MYTVTTANKNDPYHQYFNLTVTNTDTTGTTAYPLVFNGNRGQVYLSNPRRYMMSVIRLDVLTPWSLPVFIPQIQIGQNDINKTIYSIGVIDGSNSYTTNIQFTSPLTNFNTANVAIPTIKQDDSPYYYVYSYEWFLSLIVKQLNTLLNANGYSLVRLRLNPNTMNIEFLIPQQMAVFPTIIMNPPLFQLFNTFPFNLVNSTTFPALSGWYALDFNVITHNNVEYDGAYWYVYSTENSPIPIWSPVQSIVFSTSMIPVASTLVPPVGIYNQNGLSNIDTSTNSNPILTDVVVAWGDSNTSYKPFFQYIPKSEFIFTDILADAPLVEIRIEVSWKDKTGNLKPLYLTAGNSADIKILFRRKHFNIDDEI